MRKFYQSLLFLFMCCACDSQNRNKIIETQDDVGVYTYECRDIILVLNKDTLTGAFQFYDKWNASEKQFENINVFYIYGLIKEKLQNKIVIKAGYPDEFIFNGSITIGDTINLTLEDQPFGYAVYDFTGMGFKCNPIKKNPILKMGIIKRERAYLFNSFDSNEKSKIYIIKGDFVKIIEMRGGMYKIEYTPPTNSQQIYTGWIKKDDIYESDPLKWFD